MMLAEYAQHWLDEAGKNWQPATWQRRHTIIATVTRFLNVTVNEITKDMLTRWRDERKKECHANTLALEFDVLFQILSYAAKRGDIPSNPLERVERPKTVQRDPTPPTKEQAWAIIEWMRVNGFPGEADLVELLACTGCRLSEATALRWDHVDRETIRVPLGRTGRERTMPISPALRIFLDRPKSDREPGKPLVLCTDAFYALRCACRKLSLPAFSHNNFRQGFATWALQAGVDASRVAACFDYRDGGILSANGP